MKKLTGEYIPSHDPHAKHSDYLLSNGYVITLETNHYYGQFVTRVSLDDEIIWHVSRGYNKAPKWIKKWYRPIGNGTLKDGLPYPDFIRQYNYLEGV